MISVHSIGKFGRMAPIAALALVSCGPPAPRTQIDIWKVTSDRKGGYRVSVLGKAWGDGSFFASLDYSDHSGCRYSENLGGIFPNGEQTAVKIDQAIPASAKIKSATLSIDYVPEGESPMTPGAYQRKFTEERAVDALPPGAKSGLCKKGKKAAPETSFGQGSREENAAAMINMSGQLCGKVLDAYMLPDGKIAVHCTEYRSGKGRANYTIDTSTAEVVRTR